MEIKTGDFIIWRRELCEVVSETFFDSTLDADCRSVKILKDGIVLNIPVLFLNACEKLKDELVGRLLYTDLTLDQAINIHVLDKCPKSLRHILARRMQSK